MKILRIVALIVMIGISTYFMVTAQKHTRIAEEALENAALQEELILNNQQQAEVMRNTAERSKAQALEAQRISEALNSELKTCLSDK